MIVTERRPNFVGAVVCRSQQGIDSPDPTDAVDTPCRLGEKSSRASGSATAGARRYHSQRLVLCNVAPDTAWFETGANSGNNGVYLDSLAVFVPEPEGWILAALPLGVAWLLVFRSASPQRKQMPHFDLPVVETFVNRSRYGMRLRIIANRFVAKSIGALVGILMLAGRAIAAEPAASADWIDLFNGKDLSGWQLVLTDDLKGIDPNTVFQVHDGLIHVYQHTPAAVKVPIGYIVSADSYSWYHLKLQFRWGNKRFAPRVERPRDAGLLYHAGAEQIVWPRSIECQIQERDVGDCYTVHGVQVQTTFDPRQLKAGVHKYLPAKEDGVEGVWGGPSISRIVKSATHEVDGWNTVEIIVRGSEEAIHIVNGHEVFRAKNLKQLDADEKTWIPLTAGRVLLQAEYAELQYRDIQIKPIAGGPFRAPSIKTPVKTSSSTGS